MPSELRTNLVHGEGTSLSRVGPYRFCRGGTLGKLPSQYSFGYRFRCFGCAPCRFCSDGNPTSLSILLWAYLILSDTHLLSPTMVSRAIAHRRNTAMVSEVPIFGWECHLCFGRHPSMLNKALQLLDRWVISQARVNPQSTKEFFV